ncbi:uncharacterized protein LOC111261564 [Varroa jacobsoni]|uniref:uncharacterized protein LOC111261564 n=1 Tax=Varroa jacobsoni TaxID=62625 RepID=UPI000BF8A808|nr:uncharacterized protein LOC111261564 [Varroa jacobsoni]
MPPSEISPVLTEEECTHRSLREVCGLAGRPVNACSLVTVVVKNYARVRVTATPDVPLCLEYGQFKGNAFGCSGALAGGKRGLTPAIGASSNARLEWSCYAVHDIYEQAWVACALVERESLTFARKARAGASFRIEAS